MEINRIGDIAAFVAAVKAGSYTKAAGTLGLSRSAIGKSIVRLEQRHRVRLLNRTTRSLSLTDEGRMMYERYQQLLDDLDDVDNMLATRRSVPGGKLKLTAPVSFGQRQVLPVLENFLSRWPLLHADITFTDRYVDLIEEGVDIAIRIGTPKSDSRLVIRTVAVQQMITCASPAYFEKKGRPETPQQLHEHDTIFFLSADRLRTWRFETEHGTWIFEGPGRLNIDNSEAMLKSAVAGFGIIHLPFNMVHQELHDGLLIPILKSYAEKPEPISVLYPSKRHLSPRVRCFIDLLVESWQADLPWKTYDNR